MKNREQKFQFFIIKYMISILYESNVPKNAEFLFAKARGSRSCKYQQFKMLPYHIKSTFYAVICISMTIWYIPIKTEPGTIARNKLKKPRNIFGG